MKHRAPKGKLDPVERNNVATAGRSKRNRRGFYSADQVNRHSD